MRHGFAAIGVLHRQVVAGSVDARHIHAPALRRIGLGLLQFDEFGEVVVVERVGLADEGGQVVADQRLVVVNLAVLALGGGPGLPAIGRVEDGFVLLAFKRCFYRLFMFEAVEVFQEQQPRALFCVVEFGGAAAFLAEDVVDVAEGLLEHGVPEVAAFNVSAVPSATACHCAGQCGAYLLLPQIGSAAPNARA